MSAHSPGPWRNTCGEYAEIRDANLDPVVQSCGCSSLVGKGEGRGFVAVLSSPGTETVMVSSYGNSRDTAAVLRAAADRLDGGKN
jgi:hypothetical protein